MRAVCEDCSAEYSTAGDHECDRDGLFAKVQALAAAVAAMTAERDRQSAALHRACADRDAAQAFGDEARAQLAAANERATRAEADAAAMRDVFRVARSDASMHEEGCDCRLCVAVSAISVNEAYLLIDTNSERNKYSCGKCGNIFWCDAGTEENMYFDSSDRVLRPHCPKCGLRSRPVGCTLLAERDWLRSDVAMFKAQAEEVDHECKRQLETDRYKAALGRAHAALSHAVAYAPCDCGPEGEFDF